MKQAIEITTDDINTGLPKSCNDCPLGLAIQRAFDIPNNCLDVQEEHAEVFLPKIKKYKVFSLPEEVREFMKIFDTGDRDVKPISFEVELTA